MCSYRITLGVTFYDGFDVVSILSHYYSLYNWLAYSIDLLLLRSNRITLENAPSDWGRRQTGEGDTLSL